MLIGACILVSCQEQAAKGGATEADTLSVAVEDTLVPEVFRDTIEFDRLLKQYYQALPDVGDTAIWGTWEEYQNPGESVMSWQNISSDPGVADLVDSTGLPRPIHFRQPEGDSAFYLPTARYWVRCNTSDHGYETELHNYYFYQGYVSGLHTYFFPGCSVRIGGTCEYYLLDSLTSAVRVVRCEFDSPYRYVAWSARDSLLMFIANDGFSSTGMSVKLLRIKRRDTTLLFDHLDQRQYPDLTTSDLRVWQAGGFAVRIVKKPGAGEAEETVWRRVSIGRG